MKKIPKVCVTTIDPSQVGGVTTMKEYFCKMAEKNGYEPFIAFYPLDPNSSVRLKNLFFFNKIRIVNADRYLNFNSFSIGCIFPEFEFLHYLSSYKHWKSVIEQADICFAVSGTNQCCLPYVLAKKNFSCWIATTYFEDRKRNIISFSFFQKLLNFISLPFVLFFERLIFNRATRVLVLSKYTKDLIIRKYEIDESKVIITPNPIDTEFFAVNRIDHNGLRILFIGRINDPRKNVAMLIHAFSKILHGEQNVELWLVGEEISDNLQSLILKLGISDKVKCFEGVEHDDIVNYYHNCDIFALPSFQEGLGIVVLEAMSCGLPVVLTRCGGPEWLIANGVNALMVENNNTDEFVDALKRLIESNDLRLKIGSEARKTIVSKCSVNTLEKIFINTLDELSEKTRDV